MYLPGLTPAEFFQMYGDQLHPTVAKMIEDLLEDQRRQQLDYDLLLEEYKKLEDQLD